MKTGEKRTVVARITLLDRGRNEVHCVVEPEDMAALELHGVLGTVAERTGEGMSYSYPIDPDDLRDQFAIAALPAAVSLHPPRYPMYPPPPDTDTPSPYEVAATVAYALADAMLAERGRR